MWDTSWAWFFIINGFGTGSPAGGSYIITEDNNYVVTESSDNVITDGI